jgi:hypothetical protein
MHHTWYHPKKSMFCFPFISVLHLSSGLPNATSNTPPLFYSCFACTQGPHHHHTHLQNVQISFFFFFLSFSFISNRGRNWQPQHCCCPLPSHARPPATALPSQKKHLVHFLSFFFFISSLMVQCKGSHKKAAILPLHTHGPPPLTSHHTVCGTSMLSPMQ